VEAFEVFLNAKGILLSSLLSQGTLMPIVHAEADYKMPLYPGDPIEIQLLLSYLGNRSFTLESQIFKKKPSHLLVGSTKITHVFLQQNNQEVLEIPLEFRSLLQENLLN
jgi:acyl-CoA thioesterase FadM